MSTTPVNLSVTSNRSSGSKTAILWNYWQELLVDMLCLQNGMKFVYL